MKRRNLFAALLLMLPPGFTRGVRVGGERPAPSLASFPMARTIGRAYVRAYPNDALSEANVAARLPRPHLAAKVRDDFAAGRVVMIDGWMLSITEARLCALPLRNA